MMDDQELWRHMQAAHGFAEWDALMFEDAYGLDEMPGVHAQDHADPEKYGVAHAHPRADA